MPRATLPALRRPEPALELQGVVPDRVLFSPWVRRLGRIAFLGALDHAPGSRQRPTRLDHSTGVAALAGRLGRSLRLGDDSLRVLATAALLHDVGHFPLSHTAEPAFRSLWGLDHHALGRAVVLGGEPVGPARSLAPALRESGLDPERTWAVIDGDDDELGPLLSAAINLDTLDGIPRAARAFGKRVPVLPGRPFARTEEGLVVRREAVPALDRFWSLKERVYRDVINAPAHAALELRIAGLVHERLPREPPPDLLAFDDEALLRTLGVPPGELAPDEAERGSRFVAAADPGSAPVRVLRRYDVDAAVTPGADGLPLGDWPRRWRTSKHRWFLVTSSKAAQMTLPGCWEVEGDLP